MRFTKKLFALAAALTAFALVGPASALAGWAIESVPEPPGGPNQELDSVSCPTASMCAATGHREVFGSSAPISYTWNGSAWTERSLPTPEGAGSGYKVIEGVSCTSASACVAVGSFENELEIITPQAQKWNGTKWTSEVLPAPAGSNGMFLLGVSCTSPAACTAVGQYYDSEYEVFAITERWDGTEWTIELPPQPSGGLPVLFDVSCTSSEDCMAVGRSSVSGPETISFAERWDGTEWILEETTRVAECRTVGFYGDGEPIWASTWSAFSQEYDGSSWSVQTLPGLAESSNSAYGVSCVSSSSCTAAGFATVGALTSTAFAEVWNGSEWTLEAMPQPKKGSYARVVSISCVSASVCTAVGMSYDATTGTHLLVERKT